MSETKSDHAEEQEKHRKKDIVGSTEGESFLNS